ncbi:MAG: hypothetical protein CSA38_01840 [Flavobacteriales bacterium]|nr:MAG: hypothetical protein CSA38_01840 [Flavobacteriales bacterium]
MAKLKKTNEIENIHLNIRETFDFIDTWLPTYYATDTLKLLAEEDKVDKSYIRLVKTKRVKNKKIYTALYKVALQHKQELENIENKAII